MKTLMCVEELNAFVAKVFPQIANEILVEEVGPMTARIRHKVGERNLRPGGTISGPSMFGAADVAAYIATLAMIGPKALAVTTNASIDFMRKPEAGTDLIAECELLKLGRSLAVGDVRVFSEGLHDPVARATLTYSIPPK